MDITVKPVNDELDSESKFQWFLLILAAVYLVFRLVLRQIQRFLLWNDARKAARRKKKS